MEKELFIDIGVVDYKLNDKVTVSFNPTDANFVEKLYSAFEELDKKQEGYRKRISEMAGDKEVFTFTRELDAEMREIIDEVLGAPVSEALFGNVNVYAMSGGLPVWCNLMLAIMDEVDATVAKEQKASSPRLAKYTAKYQKYHK